MKILLINSLYYPQHVGGAERSVQFLAQTLAQQHDVVVVNVAPESQVYEHEGVRVHALALKNLYWAFGNSQVTQWKKSLWHGFDTLNPLQTAMLMQVIEQEQPNVVHTNNLMGFSPYVWRAIRNYGLPLVHTLRDYYLMCPQTAMFRHGRACKQQCFDCKMYAILRKRFSQNVNIVVGNAHKILKDHLNAGYFSKTTSSHVIGNIYAKKSNMLSRQITLPIRFGFLGQINPSKGIALFLEVMRRFSPSQAAGIVGGTGSEAYTRMLQKQYANLPIEFLGWTKPDEFFSRIDVLIVPSLWHDILPRVIYEGQRDGIPAIGSLRGGIPEMIEDGKTGFLFEPDNPETLYAAMQRFIDNPQLIHAMREDCIKSSSKFLPETIAAQYTAVYQLAMQPNQGTAQAK